MRAKVAYFSGKSLRFNARGATLPLLLSTFLATFSGCSSDSTSLNQTLPTNDSTPPTDMASNTAVDDDVDPEATEDALTDEDVDALAAAQAIDQTPDPTAVDDPDPEAEDTSEATAPASLAAGELHFDNVNSKGQFQNSVFDNCADPGMFRQADGSFLTVCTGYLYAQRHSSDLIHWTDGGRLFFTTTGADGKITDATVRWAGTQFAGSDKPGSACVELSADKPCIDYWAPEIHNVGANAIAYYTVRFSNPKGAEHNRHCVGVATLQGGKWKDPLGHPLLCNSDNSYPGQLVGLIDAHEFSSGGHNYLVYKLDANAAGARSIIYERELDATGLHFKAGSHSVPLIVADPVKFPWEKGSGGTVVEGPWMKQRGKYTYLFFSGGGFATNYSTAVARSTDVTNSKDQFGKHIYGQILRSNNVWQNPGHNSTMADDAGHDWIGYHAARGSNDPRQLMIDRIAWQGGWPTVNNGTPSRGFHTPPQIHAKESAATAVAGAACSGMNAGVYYCSAENPVAALECTATGFESIDACPASQHCVTDPTTGEAKLDSGGNVVCSD